MYQIEKEEPFYSSLTFLNMTNYYPSKTDKGYMRKFFTNYLILRIFGTSIWVFCFMHMMNSLKNNTGADISEDISGLTGFMGSMLTCNNFGLRHRRWSRIFTRLTDTRKFRKPPTYDATQKRGNLVSLVYILYCNIGIGIYATVSIVETGHCQRLNEEKGLDEICGTFSPAWLPFKADAKVKALLNVIQVVSAILYISPSAIICMIPWEATEIIICKIDHLKLLISEVFEYRDEDTKKSRFKFCVEYHKEILELSEELNRLVKITTGHMSLISAIVFGCIGTQMLKEASIGAMIHLGGYVIAMFCICQAGQRLMDETMSVKDTIFASKWHEASAPLVKDVQLMLLRSQKPVYIEAIPFGANHYRLFASILKTSYSYLTLISQSL